MHSETRHADIRRILRNSGLMIMAEEWDPHQIVYAQGDAAEAFYFVQSGYVKVTVLSEQGKEAVVGIAGAGQFLGEACLGGQHVRHAAATTVTKCVIGRIQRSEMLRALKQQPAFSEFFLSYVLSRNIHLESDLVDQVCNCSEKRLARVLVLLSGVQRQNPTEVVLRLNQETLAGMVGTTRPRISILLKKFKMLGLIESGGQLRVKSSLAEVVLNEKSA